MDDGGRRQGGTGKSSSEDSVLLSKSCPSGEANGAENSTTSISNFEGETAAAAVVAVAADAVVATAAAAGDAEAAWAARWRLASALFAGRTGVVPPDFVCRRRLLDAGVDGPEPGCDEEARLPDCAWPISSSSDPDAALDFLDGICFSTFSFD